MPQENQVQTEIPTDSTADGTNNETVSPDASAAPASDTSPTTTDTEPLRQKVTGEDDYQKELQAALTGSAETPKDTPEAGDTPAESNAPETPEAKEETEETPPTSTEEAEEIKHRQRVTAHDDATALALQLYRKSQKDGEPISLGEAERRANLALGKTEDAPAQQQAPETSPDAHSIDALRAQYDAKIAEADKLADDLDMKAALVAQREANTIDKQITALESRQQQTQESQIHADIEASARRTEQVYPIYKDTAHPIHQEAARIWKDFQATENPLIYDPNNTFKLYQMAANNLGISPNAKPAASVPSVKSSSSVTPKPQIVPQSAVRRPNSAAPVASGGDRTTQTGPDATADFGKNIHTAHDYEKTVRGLLRQSA